MDPNANLNLLRELITQNASVAHDDPRKAQSGNRG